MIYIKVRHRLDAGWSYPANANREFEGILAKREPSHIEGVEWITVDINGCLYGFRSDVIDIVELKDVDMVY
jgi:hypothetical protein